MSTLKPKIVLSRLDGTDWTRKGLRPFLEYRDLGLAEATDGRIGGTIGRAIKKFEPGGGAPRHTHNTGFHVIFVMRGWFRSEFEGLGEVVPVRDALLKNLGPQMLRPGDPVSDLADLFPLIYMFHQYGLGAAVDVIGSAKVPPSLQGDGQVPVQVWPVASQSEALRLLMQALTARELEIPPKLWVALAPENDARDSERFRSSAQYLFSPQDGARAVAEIVVGGLLEPARIERLITIRHQDPNALAPTEVLSALISAAFQAQASDAAVTGLAGVIKTEIAERLMVLAADQNATPETQAIAWEGVSQIETRVRNPGDPVSLRLAQEIAAFRRDPKNNVPRLRPSGAPPGPPI